MSKTIESTFFFFFFSRFFLKNGLRNLHKIKKMKIGSHKVRIKKKKSHILYIEIATMEFFFLYTLFK